MTSCRG